MPRRKEKRLPDLSAGLDDEHVLAERIKLLFGFCAELIPVKDKIKASLDYANERASTAMAAAPILGAFGQDYEEVHFEANIRARRAKAVYDLILVLEDTETERLEFQRTKSMKKANLAVLMSHLGMS
jgi:hypothetical protein